MISKIKSNVYALMAAPFRQNINGLILAIEQNDDDLLQDMLNHPFFTLSEKTKCEALNAAIKARKHSAINILLEHMNGNALECATRQGNAQLVFSLFHQSIVILTPQQIISAFLLSAEAADPSVLMLFLNHIGSILSANIKKRALVNAAIANQPLAFQELLNHLDLSLLSTLLREKLFAWAVHFGHRSIINQMLEATSQLVDENTYQGWITKVLEAIVIKPQIVEYLVVLVNNRGFNFNEDLLLFAKQHLSIDAKNGLLQVLSSTNFELWLKTMEGSITIETRMDALSNRENIPAIIRHTVDIGGMLFLAVSNGFNQAVEEILKHHDRLSEDSVLEAIIEADLNDNIQALILIEKALQRMPRHLRGNILLYAIENNRPGIIAHIIAPCDTVPANYIRLARILAANQDEPMILALGEVPRFLDDLYEVTDTEIDEARACFQNNAMLMRYCGLNESSSENEYSDNMEEDIDTDDKQDMQDAEHRSKRRNMSR